MMSNSPTSPSPATTQTFTSPPGLAAIFGKALIAGKRSGSTLSATTMVLRDYLPDRDRLTDYQRLCGFDVSDVLPHTYPHVLGFPLQMALMGSPDFPLSPAGMVHITNTITVRRALTDADRLTITVHAEDLRDHPKGMAVDIVTEVMSVDEPVWSGRSTYLSKGRSHPDGARPTTSPALPTGPAAAQWRLPGDIGRAYAAVSGDINPIHLHPLTAKALGFPRTIAHGMFSYARLLAALGPATSGPSTSQVWFKKPILVPGTVGVVFDMASTPTIAGVRSLRDPSTEHVVLSFDPESGVRPV